MTGFYFYEILLSKTIKCQLYSMCSRLIDNTFKLKKEITSNVKRHFVSYQYAISLFKNLPNLIQILFELSVYFIFVFVFLKTIFSIGLVTKSVPISFVQ